MKKVLSLILVLVVLCSFAACSNPETNGPSEDPNAAKYAKVADYVEKNRQDLLDSFVSNFTSSGAGLTCTADITASKDGFVITVKIEQFDDLADDVKAQLQAAYDAQDSFFEASLETMKEELPELGYYTIRVCDKDGELLATINAGD